LDGAEACLGGLTFASEALVSTSTLAAHIVSIKSNKKSLKFWWKGEKTKWC